MKPSKLAQSKGLLNLSQIKERVPHRHPLLLLDRVLSLEPGKSGVGMKCISGSDDVFNGHFPEDPIYPGAFIIESAAQMAAITLVKNPGDSARGMLLSVNTFRFLHPVVPGDTMVIETTVAKVLGNLARVEAKIKVADEVVARGELTLLRPLAK